MAINGNDKLVGQLRISLSELKSDVSQANKILSDLDNIKINAIDDESGKEAIKIIRSIEDEFANLKKANGESFNTKVLDGLEKSIVNLGVNIGTTQTKVTNFYKASAEDAQGAAKAFKTATEYIDEYNRKITETKYTPQVNKANGEIIKKDPTTKIVDNRAGSSSNAYKQELAAVQNESSQLAIENKLDVQALTSLNSELDTIKGKYKLTETELKPLISTQKQFTNEINSLNDAEKKTSGQSTDSYLSSYKAQLDSVKQAYLSLDSTEEKRVSDLNSLVKQTETVIQSLKLEGTSLTEATTQMNKYSNEAKTLQSNMNMTSYKDSLAGLKNSLTELTSTGKITTIALEELRQKNEALRTSYQLTNSQVTSSINFDKQLVNATDNIAAAEKKATDATEKKTLADLKQYTQDQSNLSQYNKMSTQLAKVSGEQKASMSSSSSDNSMMDRFKISQAYYVSAMAIYQVQNAFTSAIKTNEDYESSLNDLGRVLGKISDTDLQKLGQSAIQMSKDFGEPLQQVQDAMNSLAAAGVQDSASLESMTKTVMMGVNTSDIKDASTMTDLLVSSMKQLGIAYTDSEKVLDSWNKMADTSLAKTSDYAQAVSKAGMTSKAMGIDLNHLNGIVSVLANNTGQSGNAIGDAMKSIETRLEKPSTLKVLQQYGIEVMKDKDHFKDFGDIMTQVSSTLNKFGENTTQSNAIENALGGTLRKDWVDILAKNYGDVNTAAETSATSVGYSSTKSAKTMQTLAKQVEVLKTTVSEFFISLGNNGGMGQLKGLVAAGESIINVLTGMSAPAQKLLILIPEVAIAYKALSGAMKIVTGKNISQMVDGLTNIPEFKIGALDFGGQTTTVKAYNAAVNSLKDDIISGNITGKESATILGVVGGKLDMAKSSTNVYAAAQEALKDKEFASTEAGKALALEMETLKTTTAEGAATTKGAAASQDALAASQKMTLVSTLALNLAIGAIVLVVAGAITAYMSLHETIADVETSIDDLSTKMDTNKSNGVLISQYSTLESALKKTSQTSSDYATIQTQITSVQEKLATQFPTLVNGYDDAGKAVATNVKALKDYNEQQKQKILIEQGTNYNKLHEDLYAGQTSTQSTASAFQMFGDGSDPTPKVQQYTKYLALLNDEMKNGGKDTEDYGSKLKPLQTDIDSMNKAILILWSSGTKTGTYFDEVTGKTETYTQYTKRNADETKKNSASKADNSKAVKDNTNSFSDNANAVDSSTTALESAQSQEEQYQKIISTSTTKVKDYSKYQKDMAKNKGIMPASDVSEIVTKYPELLNYMSDEKTLYAQLGKSITGNKQTAQSAYISMVMNHEKAKSAIGDEAKQYLVLAAAKNKDEADTKTMSKLAQDLANNIDGVTTSTDANGNVIVNNTNLLDDQIKMLQTEGSAYGDLSNIKLGASKGDAEIDIGSTKTTYDNAKARIATILLEITAINAKAEALDKAAAASSDKTSVFAGANRAVSGGLKAASSALGSETDKIKAAMDSLDKLYADADKNTSAVIANMGAQGEGSGDPQTEADQAAQEKADKAAAAAQAKAEAAQKRQEAALKASLTAQKKEADASLDASYKIEKRHDDDIVNSLQTQLDQLAKKKQLTQDENELLKDQNDLDKAKSDLLNAQTQQDVLVYMDNKWQYVADQLKVSADQSTVTTAQSTLDQKKQDIAYQNQEDSLNAQKTAAENTRTQHEQTYQDTKTATDAGYDDKINAINGYATGVDAVPKDGIYTLAEGDVPELVTKEQKVRLPAGAGVYNGNETRQVIGGTAGKATQPTSVTASSANKMAQSVVTNDTNAIAQTTKKTLAAVDNVIQNFADNSSSYPKDTEKNVGKSINDNKDLINKPLAILIKDVTNNIQGFVNSSPQFSKDTNKNIGTAIGTSASSVIEPTKLLLSDLNTTFTTFVASTSTYGLNITKDIGTGMQSGVKDLEKIINDLCTTIINDFHTDLGIHSPSTIAYDIGAFWTKGLINGMSESDINSIISSKLGGMVDSTRSTMSGSVDEWINEALKLTGQSASLLQPLKIIAQHESDGDPNNVNTYDSNAAAGHPSKGIMQMIDETFSRYALPGHNQIFNPVDNIASSIRYDISRYGSVQNVPGVRAVESGRAYVGYEGGTTNAKEGLAYVNEHNGQEMRMMNSGDGVITAHRTQAISDFADKIPDIMSTFKMPSFQMPDIKIIVPNSSGGGDTHLHLGNMTLPYVKSGSQIVSSLQQIVKTHNY